MPRSLSARHGHCETTACVMHDLTRTRHRFSVDSIQPQTRVGGWAFGARVTGRRVRFRLWAPVCSRIAIDGVERALPMRCLDDGWHELTTTQARPGSRYRFVLPDATAVPDPASRYQPRDVQSPSEVIDSGAYAWQVPSWRGRP